MRFINLPHKVVEMDHASLRKVVAEQKAEFTKSVREMVLKEPAVIVPLTTDSLEWTLSSPPPLHQFEEPPIFVETEHLDLHPRAEVETLLKDQGEKVSDVFGAEHWEEKDAAEFEGKIPQNAEWTEFIEVEKK